MLLQGEYTKEDTRIRRTLDILFNNIETIEDIKLIKYSIDDYIEEGYQVKDYIPRLNNIFFSLYI